MDPNACQAVFIALAAIGLVWWCFDLWLALGVGRGEELGGETVIDGSPSDLGESILRAMRQPSLGLSGVTFRAEEKSDRSLRVKKIGAMLCNQPNALWFSEIDFQFNPTVDGKTRVAFRIGRELLSRRLRGIAVALVFFVGLPGLLLVTSLVWFLVVPSEDPVVRWQVFQTLQMVHFLWPPLLVIGLHRMGRSAPMVYVENLLGSLDNA